MIQTNDGWLHREDNLLVYFGKRQTDRAKLQSLFPDLKWASLEQVHSPTVLLADPEIERRGDAHFTATQNLALLIKTADCVPLMLSSERGLVAAVHAGWRGVATDIVTNTIRQMLRLTDKAQLRAWIGPHIQWTSFEVGDDVAELLKQAYQRANSTARFEALCTDHLQDPHLQDPHLQDPKKVHVNLTEIVRAQLASHGVQIVDEVMDDTKTTASLASYRRDGATAGRNLSLIARI
ncbi:MAG TPA: polyphenol oxidase family protein [Pseudobdellovibrionaceae bacterium]|nr:polyphenol oxidase family protein [Pseudobdellovibrionaceae bacterium]